MKHLLILAVVLLAGCDTINSYGLGGEPVLMCKARDGTAHIDDKLIGQEKVHASVVRRFSDADRLCEAVKPAAPAATAAAKP